MKLVQLILFLIVFPLFLKAQPPTIQWEKGYGGSLYDGPGAIVSVPNGYVVGGYSSSSDIDLDSNFGLLDAWLFKIDNVGNLLWHKSFGGTKDDYFISMKQTSDDGFIIGGTSKSNDGDVIGNNGGKDFWIVKTDSLGTIEWQKNYGGSNTEDLLSIEITSDGGYIAIGVTRSNDGDVIGHHPITGIGDDFWIVKMDGSGNLQWQKCLGGSGEDYGYGIRQTSDLGYIVTGVSNSYDGDVTASHLGDDFWVAKIDSVGTIQWEKTYGGPYFELANYILPTYNGGFILAGQAESSTGDLTDNHGGKDCWILKIDSIGNIEWQKNYGGVNNEIAYSVVQNPDSTYNILALTTSNDFDVSGNHGGKDIWFFKLNSVGNLLWQKCFGGTLNDEAYMGLETTFDGTFIIAGNSKSNDMDVTGNYGDYDCWIIKLNVPVGVQENEQDTHNIKLYPNPSNGSMTLECNLMDSESGKLIIYDITGKLIHTYNLVNGTKKIAIDAQFLDAGIYLYDVIVNGKKIRTNKLTIIK